MSPQLDQSSGRKCHLTTPISRMKTTSWRLTVNHPHALPIFPPSVQHLKENIIDANHVLLKTSDPFAPLYAEQVEDSLTTDRMIGNSILHRFPPEIFGKICSTLEPVWLVNLSNTCHAMTVKLSFESGNKIWYDVMPSTLWRESEHYQDEDELWVAWMRQNHPELFCPREERVIGMNDCQVLGM